MEKSYEEKFAAFLDSFFLEYICNENAEKRVLSDDYWQELFTSVKKDFTASQALDFAKNMCRAVDDDKRFCELLRLAAQKELDGVLKKYRLTDEMAKAYLDARYCYLASTQVKLCFKDKKYVGKIDGETLKAFVDAFDLIFSQDKADKPIPEGERGDLNAFNRDYKIPLELISSIEYFCKDKPEIYLDRIEKLFETRLAYLRLPEEMITEYIGRDEEYYFYRLGKRYALMESKAEKEKGIKYLVTCCTQTAVMFNREICEKALGLVFSVANSINYKNPEMYERIVQIMLDCNKNRGAQVFTEADFQQAKILADE